MAAGLRDLLVLQGLWFSQVPAPTFLVMKLALSAKRAEITFAGKRAGVNFAKVDC